MFTVYVAQSLSTGKIYIGQTENTTLRELRHNQELSFRKKSYTFKNKGPWKIVYSEKYITRAEALKREKQLKSYRGREFVKSILTEVL